MFDSDLIIVLMHGQKYMAKRKLFKKEMPGQTYETQCHPVKRFWTHGTLSGVEFHVCFLIEEA